ncbi:MAG: DNA gyrase inhibitor YacG [Nitrospira sp. WS238]|nr:DNA gyrase inhibitor YacG [Nitrospira sp. WS238]
MTCPLCHRPTTWEGNPWRPFCCERCQVIDLGTWAIGQYRIPGSSLTAETGRREPLSTGERTDDAREETAGGTSIT